MKFEKSILVLTHSDYVHTDAGVEKVIQGQQKLFLENGYNFIAVYPLRKDLQIFGLIHSRTLSGYGLIVNGEEKGEITQDELMSLVQMEGLCSVIIHELVTFKKNDQLFTILDRISCPIYYFVHDYAMVCYNHVLMRNNKEFCGTEPLSFKKCSTCRFYLEGKLNEVWQRKFVERYPKITYVFPSAVVRDIWQKHFQAKNRLLIVPNTKFGNLTQKYEKKGSEEKLKIAFIGYGRVEKGWKIWQSLCEKYEDRYELYVLGDGECSKNVKRIPVSVAKDGPNAMVDAIRREKIDIAFLWSMRPETYAYTFFEAYVGGCYIITNPQSGNIYTMTEELKCGKVLKNEEALWIFLENQKEVRTALHEMYKEKAEHPVILEDNDRILAMIKGEKS